MTEPWATDFDSAADEVATTGTPVARATTAAP